MKLIKKLLIKYKELILYGIFGVLTTIINILCFYLLDLFHVNTYVNNFIAWVVSVIFAFITNKLFVFESKSLDFNIVKKELVTFVGARIASLLVDMLTIYLMFDVLHINKMISKIISNILVIIINYVLSKLVVFKKK